MESDLLEAVLGMTRQNFDTRLVRGDGMGDVANSSLSVTAICSSETVSLPYISYFISITTSAVLAHGVLVAVVVDKLDASNKLKSDLSVTVSIMLHVVVMLSALRFTDFAASWRTRCSSNLLADIFTDEVCRCSLSTITVTR